MDQNTNNSFTSAPQGGDFSDIIIPNAYAAKPKDTKLKKIAILVLAGLAVVFLLDFILKKNFVDHKTMSKQEFIQLAESEEMDKITDLESLLDYIYNGSVSFSDIMDEKTHGIINIGMEAFKKENSLLLNKDKIHGGKDVDEMYDALRKDFNDRFNRYQKSTKMYNDLYEAYNNYDSGVLSTYLQDSANLKEYFEKVIDSINSLKLIDDSLIQLTNHNSSQSEKDMVTQLENISNEKNQVVDKLNLSVSPKFIFSEVYSEKNYEQEELLKTSIDKILTYIRK